MRTVSAIVPAAGLSTRFGGPNKLLQPWGNTTMVGSVVGALLDCGLEVLVVTGRDADAVSQAVQPARTVYNAQFEKGLGTSIAFGVSRAADGGYLIALGDMPGLRTEVVQLLLGAYEVAEADSIIAPVYADEPNRIGHPVLFGSVHRQALMDLRGDQGARTIVQAAGPKLVQISVPGRLPDIDAPE